MSGFCPISVYLSLSVPSYPVPPIGPYVGPILLLRILRSLCPLLSHLSLRFLLLRVRLLRAELRVALLAQLTQQVAEVLGKCLLALLALGPHLGPKSNSMLLTRASIGQMAPLLDNSASVARVSAGSAFRSRRKASATASGRLATDADPAPNPDGPVTGAVSALSDPLTSDPFASAFFASRRVFLVGFRCTAPRHLSFSRRHSLHAVLSPTSSGKKHAKPPLRQRSQGTL
ncbi:hypothetical protein BV20DRAFT_1058613 [Pilatotrama ljubarskyi]|nr:hypothetical protein BV20DRAFT_1058613 [Pilatotrama ljubarskyi]